MWEKRSEPLTLLLACALFAQTCGCATYRARQLPLSTAASTSSSIAQSELELGAALWYSKLQTQLYFDTNLPKRRLAPVYVALKNQGSHVARLRVAKMQLAADNVSGPLSPVSFDAATDRMRRKAIGPAVVWAAIGLVTLFFALIFSPMGSALAISQTASVNDRMKQDIWTKILKDTDLSQGQEIRGVVFFDMPKGVKALEQPRLICPVGLNGPSDAVTLELKLT